MTTRRGLTEDQGHQFLQDGFCIVPGAIDREFCRQQCQKVLAHIGVNAYEAFMQKRQAAAHP